MYRFDTNLVSPGVVSTSTYEIPAACYQLACVTFYTCQLVEIGMCSPGPYGADFKRSPVWLRLERANGYQLACPKEGLTAGGGYVLLGPTLEGTRFESHL